MMDVYLYPRVAPAGRLRFWLGVVGQRAPGQVRWKLDGAAVQAQALRPLVPAHLHGAKCSTGVFEIDKQVEPGGLYRVSATIDGESATAQVRAVPAEIPEDGWLRILLVSCYHRVEDHGYLARTIDGLPASQRPHFSILMGDQVYLDLPTLDNFPNDEAKLARKFEDQYRRNWTQRRGLRSVLSLAPSISAPDDHEYWNNFPHAATVIQNSWSSEGRQRWRRAAESLYDAFQVAAPAQRGDPMVVDVPPLSILILDQRSLRREDAASALTEEALVKVEEWVEDLRQKGFYGAVVTGQPLLDTAASPFEEKYVDRTLLNYGDYPRLVSSLLHLADAGRPVLLLTGDVHWGRVTRISEGGRDRFYEVICSPASLVTSVGADQVKTIGSAISALFGGQRKRWPRHSDPRVPPDLFAGQALSPRKLVPGSPQTHKGDQVAILKLRRSAGALEMKVDYHELHDSPRPPKVFGPWLLRRQM